MGIKRAVAFGVGLHPFIIIFVFPKLQIKKRIFQLLYYKLSTQFESKRVCVYKCVGVCWDWIGWKIEAKAEEKSEAATDYTE